MSTETLKEKVQKTIQTNQLIEEKDKVLVGVSGGPDSISLLNILYELGYDLCVAHVNHGLREKAKQEEEYVKEFCYKKSIPCFVKKIDLKASQKGMTIEEAGREERYHFFVEVLQQEKCTKIATAHNSNDNAETVLMNMIRGSGISGLKGILAKQQRTIQGEQVTIIRPLLECNRQEIEQYCDKMQLHPQYDESNNDTLYTRNKIRLELIPYIEKNINSNIIQNINRLSMIAAEEERYITEQTDKAYEACCLEKESDKVVCQLKIFNTLDSVIQKRLIMKMIIKVLGNAKDIEKVHVEDILKLCKNNVGGKYLTPNKNIKVSIQNSKVFYEKIDNTFVL